MPLWHGYPKTKVANRELEETASQDVEELAKVPELIYGQHCTYILGPITDHERTSRVLVCEVHSMSSRSMYSCDHLEGKVNSEGDLQCQSVVPRDS
jgi:hypothetical protein